MGRWIAVTSLGSLYVFIFTAVKSMQRLENNCSYFWSKLDTEYSETVKDHCRKINLMEQIDQPFWQQMSNIKNYITQIAEIELYVKREAANKGSNADLCDLSHAMDLPPKSCYQLQHHALRPLVNVISSTAMKSPSTTENKY
jgi:hypothetical protein